MTDEELAGIEARVNAATERVHSVRVDSPVLTTDSVGLNWPLSWERYVKDATAFYAHARTDVPALVAEVRRLRALVKEAYEEGREEGGGQSQGGMCGGDYPESWAKSEARRALDAKTAP
jgi:hypothetical protein